MPLLRVKKEVFHWVEENQKSVDIRKGKPQKGDIAVFQCGPHHLRRRIAKKETGKLTELVREDNYKAIIPTANSREEAIGYLQFLYGTNDGIFTAYYLKTG
jgi:hypothetical protein